MAIPYNFYFLHADCKVVKLPHYARISGSDAKKVKGKIQKCVEMVTDIKNDVIVLTILANCPRGLN